MAVLVTGATGLIGRALVKSLIDSDETIHVLSRDPVRASALMGKSVNRIFAWHPATDDLPEAALEGVKTIFHLMGEPVGGRWSKAKVDAIAASRITSAGKIARFIKGQRCRFITASSFGIYAGHRGVTYEETSPLPRPLGRIQQILCAAEQAATSACTIQTQVNMVRFGIV